MANVGCGPPRPPLPPAMEDEDDGPGDAAPAAASPTGTAPATDYDPRRATATSRSTASSPTTTAPTTAPSTATSRSARSAASATASSLPSVSLSLAAPAPPPAGAPQQPQNPQANGGSRGEPGGAAAIASSTSAQIWRRPGGAKAAALARAAGASDVPVARATTGGAPKRTAPMTSVVQRPAPVRTMTPTRATTAAEGAELHSTSRKVDFSAEFEKLANSVATIGGGLTKILAGCGVKIISKEEKERKAAEEKAAAEEKRNAEQKAIEEEKALSPEDAVIWKEEKEEKEKKMLEEKEKEKRVAFLLAIPTGLAYTSTILDGIKEIASGSKDSVFAVGTMMRGIISAMAWKRGSATGSRREGHEIMTSAASLGTGSLGLRTAIDRQIVTRAYDGGITVIDGFGPRKQRISHNLMGTRLITTMEELRQAISDFKYGNLYQMVDIDKKKVTLLTAYSMWIVLCSKNLTGILHQHSPLPEMALRARSLLDEEAAVKSQLDDIHNATSELESVVSELRQKLEEKLEEKPPKQKTD